MHDGIDRGEITSRKLTGVESPTLQIEADLPSARQEAHNRGELMPPMNEFLAERTTDKTPVATYCDLH
jgi:hypothetical protein